MACCLIAMMLLAQCVATLRRWGAFWGLVPVPAGVEYVTVADHVRRWMARREVRIAVALIALVEVGAIGSWISLRHGEHVRGFVVALCSGDRAETIRIALN